MIMVTFLPKLQICALAQFVSIVTFLYQVLLQCSSHRVQLYVYYCLSSDNQTPLFLTTCLLVNSHTSFPPSLRLDWLLSESVSTGRQWRGMVSARSLSRLRLRP